MRNTAWALGVLGLAPFVLMTFAILTADEPSAIWARAMLFYGATILAFLGGIHWGLALSGERDANLAQGSEQTSQTVMLILGVAAQLFGFGALLLPMTVALASVGAALLAVLGLDLFYVRIRLLPRWFAPLRVVLSLGAAASLSIAATALVVRP